MRNTNDDDEPEGVRHPGSPPKRPRSMDSFPDIDGTFDPDEPEQTREGGAGPVNDHTEEPVEAPAARASGGSGSGRTDSVYGTIKVEPPGKQRKEAWRDEASPRVGNYLFTVGLAGSGKSTFQRHLLWFLRRGPNDIIGPQYRLSSGAPDSAGELAFTQLESTWETEYREGRFPEQTSAELITPFYFDAQPINKDLNGPIDFGFFEIAGEHFENIRLAFNAARESERDRKLAAVPRPVTDLLQSQSKIMFVFMANCLEGDEDDAAFSAFLQYLRRFENADFEKRTSLALVISYPEVARQRILNKIVADSGRSPQTRNEDERETVQRELREAVAAEMSAAALQTQFLNAFFPKTAAEIKYWNQISGSRVNRADVFLFSVGKVQELAGRDRKLVRAEFEDVGNFFDWMFHRLTGRPMRKPRPFTALLRWLESIGSGKP